MSRPRPTCSTPTSSNGSPQGRKLSVEAVDAVARGRVWTGADALERGLVDELGGLRTAISRAKVLAGLDADADVRIVELSRLVAAGHPAAQAVVAACRGVAAGGASAALLGRSVAEMFGQAERSLTGVNALWLGDYRF